MCTGHVSLFLCHSNASNFLLTKQQRDKKNAAPKTSRTFQHQQGGKGSRVSPRSCWRIRWVIAIAALFSHCTNTASHEWGREREKRVEPNQTGGWMRSVGGAQFAIRPPPAALLSIVSTVAAKEAEAGFFSPGASIATPN
jgi:hypothetical protein